MSHHLNFYYYRDDLRAFVNAAMPFPDEPAMKDKRVYCSCNQPLSEACKMVMKWKFQAWHDQYQAQFEPLYRIS